MEKQIQITGEHQGQICIEYMSSLNYAMVLNKQSAISKLELRNSSARPWRNICVFLTGELIEPCQQSISFLKPKKAISIVDFDLRPVLTKLMALTESVQTAFCLTVTIDDEQVMRHSLPLVVMTVNQWHGIDTLPELITSYITPNYPGIQNLCRSASECLKQATGKDALDDYQSQDRLQVANQVEAMFNALRKESITYITSPANFEVTGQRVRLVDQTLNSKMGNCLDLSLLMCSCLEGIGLHTMMVLFNSHAIMGVWTEESVWTPMVGYDVRFLKKSIDDGRRLILIDATAIAAGCNLSEAMAGAEKYLDEHAKEFNLFVDVQSARNNGIRPLPHCILTETGWMIEEDGMAHAEDNWNVNKAEDAVVALDKLENKRLLWERKLLDLSLCNNLLNMKRTGQIVAFKDVPTDDILKAFKTGKLLDLLDTKDNLKTTKELYRSARNSLEENGANTLFLSIGVLKWYDNTNEGPFLAPVIFIPVEIVRQNSNIYIVRMRDEEPLLNTTLFEKLRQDFGIDIPRLSFMMDHTNVLKQWKGVLAELQENIDALCIDTKKPWEVKQECRLGVFSFSKFVMWNDIHTASAVLEKNRIIGSLITGQSFIASSETEVSARELDKVAKPSEYAIPLDVDSSQLEAIVKSGKDESFVLYGPPGTGKSQTITNMIANALYQGKRVLFVAEKKAALEVVQERLGKIGLTPFCLELHSNKADKKSFLAQMSTVLDIQAKPQHPFFEEHSDELFAKRQELNAYIDALHQKREQGLSLYEYINRYQEIEGEMIPLTYQDICHFGADDVEDIRLLLLSLDKVEEILGSHPAENVFMGLYPLENSLQNQTELTRLLSLMPDEIAWAKKKAGSLLNRIIMKKTPMQLIKERDCWKRLCSLAVIDETIISDLDALEDAIRRWNEHVDHLRLWYHFSTVWLKLLQHNVLRIQSYYLQHNGASTSRAFAKGYFMRMIHRIIDQDSALRSFNGMLFEDTIGQFRCLTRNFQKLTVESLQHKLTKQVAEAMADKELSEEITTLRKKISTNGRAVSVRKMIEQTHNLLPRLCPCMLMSPLSVAQYLEMTAGMFDLVIFDEASQMPTSEAIGAIARGKNVVVVGDLKQMPPTSFFVTNSTNEDDIDIDDMESILEDCISISLPRKYLNWHYRSRHESLIAFSNAHFYDGQLVTFPSVDDQDCKVSLQYVNGTYDFGKTRSNQQEAKAVVADVIARLRGQLPVHEGGKGTPHRSIGIVSFNKNQANLIEDFLMDALAKDTQLEELALKSDEPIFVKNLENVQGDERDIILFSVGYGPDKNGKVSMNFGPLNQAGGERRLNVAVSRARYEMKVFSTLHPHQIDLQRTNAMGVRGLKRFLEYAETGVLPCPVSQLPDQGSDTIVEQISQKFREKGFEVYQNVGNSKFNIDIALVDKNNPSRYAIGIIVDTPEYRSIPTASDREIVYPDILHSLGWTLHHIWSVDWMERPEKCLKDIMKAVVGDFGFFIHL